MPSSPSSSSLYSNTPFDISLYENDENPFANSSEEVNEGRTLAVDPSTQLIVGLNKYSHDTSICAADALTGKVLFALSKERLSRRKHDGGNVVSIVESCLDQLDLDLDNIQKIVVNNHHHRVMHMESDELSMEWEEGLGINGGTEDGYADENNLLMSSSSSSKSKPYESLEISHHLAHAYSAASQAPFKDGLIVIMDGMGETYRTMRAAIESSDQQYICDLDFEGQYECVPHDIRQRSERSIFDWREGESAYIFDKKDGRMSVKPIFKRFIQERTPPTLYNHGFENMQSAGALYSRVSSHIFGDWNACGKVMGLAPWMGHTWNKESSDTKTTTTTTESETVLIKAKPLKDPIMWGSIYKNDDDAFDCDPSPMKGLPHIARHDPDLFDLEAQRMKPRYDFDDNGLHDDINPDESSDDDTTRNDSFLTDDEQTSKPLERQLPAQVALDAISLSSRIQNDLEVVAMDFISYLKQKYSTSNMCFAGGVALNSVLNGRLTRELGFENVYIPPYPGDDGISIGCCAYGLFGNYAHTQHQNNDTKDDDNQHQPPLWSEPLSPYTGPKYIDTEILQAIEAASPWIQVKKISNDEDKFHAMAKEIESGGVIAWFQGRSEMGPRALGHRSIIADPRLKGMVRYINQKVKKRESFRPFAPSVLAEYANEWFDLDGSVSPYMSLTANLNQSKKGKVPAITHVDGSSRLQTVEKNAEPSYHRFITKFYENTGVPMVLNTSFNIAEPVVETPSDAIRTFLRSMGSIEFLVLDQYIIKRKEADVKKLLGETGRNGELIKPPSFPVRAGDVEYETKFSIMSNANGDNEEENIVTKTRIRMVSRQMHDENDKAGGWFELIDDLEGELLGVCDGSVGVNEILSQYLETDKDIQKDDPRNDPKYRELFFENILTRLVRLYDHGFISW